MIGRAMSSNLEYSVRGKKLVLLKHRPFNPQISAALESNVKAGTLDNVHRILDSGRVLRGELNTLLANSIENNISRGRISDIVGGWKTERFSFLLVIEILDLQNELIGEEIYQGYTDRADTTMGNLTAGASVKLDPQSIMYINKVLSIKYGRDANNRLVPKFDGSSSLLSSYSNTNDRLLVLRPMDVSSSFLNKELQKSFSNDNLDIVNDVPILSDISKFSTTGNDVGGRMLNRLITSANTARNADIYTSIGVETTGNYEEMLNELYEPSYSSYRFLRWLSTRLGRINISNFTIGDLFKYVHGLNPIIHTVESYNDVISKTTAQALNFRDDSDNGDSVLVDNQLTRFHKKIIPYLFTTMLSCGFVHFAGRITNKTIDGSIHVDHSLILSVSDTVNTNPTVRGHLLNLLYTALQNNETREILSGGTNQEVEMVFDLSLVDSIVSVIINGNEHRIRVPSMADSTFSSLITTKSNSDMITNDLYGVVDGIMNIQKDYGSKIVTTPSNHSYDSHTGGRVSYGNIRNNIII